MSKQSQWFFIVHWLRLYFGANLLFSGIRYAVTGFVPDIPGVGGEWVQANANIYLYQIIKYLEIVTGLMLCLNRYPLLALILQFPASINIFWLNTFIVATPRQLFSGPQELFMNGVLLLAYSGWMAAALKPKLDPLWLWRGDLAYQSGIAQRRVSDSDNSSVSAAANGSRGYSGRKDDMRKGRWLAIAACAGLTAVAYIGSTGLFYADYREIRNRDLVGYAVAWIGMLYMMVRLRNEHN